MSHHILTQRVKPLWKLDPASNQDRAISRDKLRPRNEQRLETNFQSWNLIALRFNVLEPHAPRSERRRSNLNGPTPSLSRTPSDSKREGLKNQTSQ